MVSATVDEYPLQVEVNHTGSKVNKRERTGRFPAVIGVNSNELDHFRAMSYNKFNQSLKYNI